MANYFSLFLVVLTIGSGLIWLADSLIFAPKRKEKVIAANQGADPAAIKEAAPLPYIVDTAQQIFPVIAFVLILRSFLYEPFQIPSGSMMPTLLVGDFILVEKYAYGLKDPVVRNKFLDTGSPKRGDVAVFKFPLNPNLDYIKRIVGLPGDTIIYRNKQLYIKPACTTNDDTCPALEKVDMTLQDSDAGLEPNTVAFERFSEKLGEVEHQILRNPRRNVSPVNYYQQPGTKMNEWLVPEGHYFAMGDNRDNSEDSRYWGFVPDDNLVGKAVAIWISFEFDRPPSSWVPGWIPTGVRFDRIGGIE